MRQLQKEGNDRRRAYLQGCTDDLGGLVDLSSLTKNELLEYGKIPLDVEEPIAEADRMLFDEGQLQSVPYMRELLVNHDPFGLISRHLPVAIAHICRQFSLVIAGGFVCDMIRVRQRSWRERTSFNDIDIYMHTANVGSLPNIIRAIQKLPDGHHVIFRTKWSINFYYAGIKYQIICATFDSISQLLYLFDIPAVSACLTFTDDFRGHKILCTPECLWQHLNDVIVFDPCKISFNYNTRLCKYRFRKKFRVIFPGYHGETNDMYGIAHHVYFDYRDYGDEPATMSGNISGIINAGYADHACAINNLDSVDDLLAGKYGHRFAKEYTDTLLADMYGAYARWLRRRGELQQGHKQPALYTREELGAKLMAVCMGPLRMVNMRDLINQSIALATHDQRTHWYGDAVDYGDTFPAELWDIIMSYAVDLKPHD